MNATIKDEALLRASKYAEEHKRTNTTYLTTWNGYMVYESRCADYDFDDFPFLILVDKDGLTRSAMSSECLDILLSASEIN